MTTFDIALNWIHILGAVLFLGTMFMGTFVILPVLKAHVDHAPRRQFIVNFIPKVRRIIRIVVAALVITGVARALLLHYTHEGPADVTRLGIFGLKMAFAAVPVAIFFLAPRILGAKSEDGLCCDPDAEDAPVMKVMSATGANLHYAAISGGWLAVLCGVILAHMR
jgi:uncharacterized membrane protein